MDMNWLGQLRVGDTVYIKGAWSSNPGRTVVVEKIGRKWIHLKGGLELNKVTHQVQDSNFVAYPSEQVWRDHIQLMSRASNAARHLDTLRQTRRVTIEQVEAIEAALGLAPKKSTDPAAL